MNLFIDTNAFLYFAKKEKNWKKVNEIFENSKYKLYTNILVINELKFKLLWAEASKKLNSNNKFQIIKEIKTNIELRKEVYSKFIPFYTNLKKLVRIFDVTNEDELTCINESLEYGLLPTDASIVATMKNNDISTILTSDSDFNDIEGIDVIKV